MMFKNKSVSSHQFAMVPRADIPRASFRMERAYKTTFDAGYLIPVLCEEVLPGDTFRLKMTAFCRLATPLFPVMDNLHLDSFFFFVPNRLVWNNWQRFMGEQDDPGDSISFLVPTMDCPSEGYLVNSLQDYFGLPTVGQVGIGSSYTHSALPLRGYNLVFNSWFRDENLIDSAVVDKDDGPDTYTDYVLRRRGKRHDYFTSCLPWPNKDGVSIGVPIVGEAPVRGKFVSTTDLAGTADPQGFVSVSGSANVQFEGAVASGTNQRYARGATGDLFADLSSSTAATINEIRQAFQIQRLLERDARGGTRYIEIIRAHFGVISPDARLQRPEYLGGGSTPIVISPIAQTSETTDTGTPLGNLAAVGTAVSSGHGFSQSFTEHGYIIGLVSVRADLTYQQGLRRHWSRQTRYDFYFPAFAMLGEQAVLNQEIFCDGTGSDPEVFGYQERWAEYRYSPSEITGRFRSTSATPLDAWHLAQDFAAVPVLGETFISESPPVERIVAIGSEANGSQFLFDSVFEISAARPMPLYSVPGMIDHF